MPTWCWWHSSNPGDSWFLGPTWLPCGCWVKWMKLTQTFFPIKINNKYRVTVYIICSMCAIHIMYIYIYKCFYTHTHFCILSLQYSIWVILWDFTTFGRIWFRFLAPNCQGLQPVGHALVDGAASHSGCGLCCCSGHRSRVHHHHRNSDSYSLKCCWCTSHCFPCKPGSLGSWVEVMTFMVLMFAAVFCTLFYGCYKFFEQRYRKQFRSRSPTNSRQGKATPPSGSSCATRRTPQGLWPGCSRWNSKRREKNPRFGR